MAYLPPCVLAYLLSYLHTCLFAYLHTYAPAFFLIYLPTYHFASLSAFLLVSCTSSSACSHASSAYSHTYLRTSFSFSDLHTCLLTHRRTFVLTCTRTHVLEWNLGSYLFIVFEPSRSSFSPFTRLEGPEGLQRRIHPGKVPELDVEVEATGDQPSAGRVETQRRDLRHNTKRRILFTGSERIHPLGCY